MSISKDRLEKYHLLIDAIRLIAEEDSRLSKKDFQSLITHLDSIENIIDNPIKLNLEGIKIIV